jgi:hypothetical protein
MLKYECFCLIKLQGNSVIKPVFVNYRILWFIFVALANITYAASQDWRSDCSTFSGMFSVESSEEWKTIGRGEVMIGKGIARIKDCFIVGGMSDWKNYEISFQSRAIRNAEQVQIWSGFRYTGREQRYALGLRGGNCDDIYLCRYSPDGNDRFLALEPLDFHPEPGQWYRMRIVVNDGHIQVYLNDETLPRLKVLDEQPLACGQIVLGGGWISTEFKDLKVTNLNSQADANNVSQRANVDSFSPNRPGWERDYQDKDKPLELTIARKSEKEHKREVQRRKYRPVSVSQLSDRRNEIALNGKWLFKPDYEITNESAAFDPNVEDDTWHVMDVPAFWNPVKNWLYRQPCGFDKNGSGVSDNWIEKDNVRWQNYTFEAQKTKAAWYRQWVVLPQNIKGKHFRLSFDAVAKIADIWVNGKYVGGHIGMFGPFEIDISNALQGGRNLIAIRVATKQSKNSGSTDKKIAGVAVSVEVTEEMLNSLPHGMYNSDHGGIWQPVKLVVSNPVYIEDVFAKTRTDGADIDVEVNNSGSEDQIITVGMKISPLDSGKPLYDEQCIAMTTIKAGMFKNLSLRTSKLMPLLWSPETPNLYNLCLSIYDNDRVIDQTTTTIGFRTFKISGNKFYLNGKPYWLRGANQTPMPLAPNDNVLAKRFMGLMHNGNEMITRTHGSAFSETWLQAADHIGIGVSYEGTWPWLMLYGPTPDSKLIQIWKDEQISLVKHYRNHPSILLWTINNEMKFTIPQWDFPNLSEAGRIEKWKVLSSAIKLVRDVDPTRPIVADSAYTRRNWDWEKNLKPANIDDGDVDDLHAYYGWYVPGAPFCFFTNAEWLKLANTDRPFISQECSTGYPNNDTGHPTRHYIFNHYTAHAIVGDWAYEDHDPAYFLKRHAFMSKEVEEAIRRSCPQAAGVLHLSNSCWFKNVYDANSIEPYPVYNAMRYALQPVLVSAELYGRNFYAGSSYSCRVCVVNDQTDGQTLDNSELRWCVVNAGKTLSSGQCRMVAVAQYDRKWQEIKFVIPAGLPIPKIDCLLVLELYRNGKKISENYYDLCVVERRWIYPSSDLMRKKKIALFDTSNQFADILKNYGFQNCKAIDNIANIADCNFLIIANADSLSEFPQWEQVRSFAESGKTVLLIHPGLHMTKLFPDMVKSVLDEPGDMVNIRVYESPVFDGIGPLELSWWQTGISQPYVCRRSFRLAKVPGVVPLATFMKVHGYLPRNKVQEQLKELSGSPLLEIKVGKGKIMVSEMALEAGTNDPIAARLFTNILTYLLN